MLLGWVATKRAVFCWQLAMFLRYIRPCSDSLSALPMSVWAIWLAPHGPFCRAWTISTLAILWRFIIMFLILVCWQPESMVFSRRVFLFRQEFSFSQSYRFFPSFCQALADCNNPHQKKKKCEAHYQCKGRWGSLHWERSRTGRRVFDKKIVPVRYLRTSCFS